MDSVSCPGKCQSKYKQSYENHKWKYCSKVDYLENKNIGIIRARRLFELFGPKLPFTAAQIFQFNFFTFPEDFTPLIRDRQTKSHAPKRHNTNSHFGIPKLSQLYVSFSNPSI